MGRMLKLAMVARSRLALDQPPSQQGHHASPIDLTIMERFRLTASTTAKESSMNQVFHVQGMSCSHCVQAVTGAVQALDPQAQVKVDLPTGKVEVLSAQDRAALARAIREEGYTVKE
jgi:copper chaperone